MAAAFGREDERTSYLANNRYQDYQNQYKPEKNYSASSQLDRQIRMQNTALALRFQAPTATSLGRMDVPKPTFQTPTIKFDFLGNNAPKIPNALRAAPQPEALTAPIKPGLLGTIGNALKAVGHVMAYPFQKIGQGIAGLIQRAFGAGTRTTTLTESQRATLSAYRNIQPAGDGTFKATGQTVAFGRTWEEGATFKVEGDQLRLIQGTSFERTFGGIERKDGGLMPLKMAEVNGHIQPTGLDFDRLAPNTALTIKSPMTIEGFGELKAGEMTYQGAWKSPDGQTTGGRFKFENTLLDLNKDLAHGMDMNNPVALRQATFALQAGLMRLNSAVVEKGSRKYYVSQDQSPMEIGRLEKTAGDLTKASEANFGKIETIKKDLTHRSEAAGHFYKVLSEATGQAGSMAFEFKERFNDLEKEAGAIRAGSQRINDSVNAGDYAALDTATAEVARRQEALTQTTGRMTSQAEALRGLQRGFRGMAEEAKGVFLKADGEKLKSEGPLTDEELGRRATAYFPEEKARVNAAAGKTLDAVKSLVDEGVLTPEQGTQMGAQIMALRDRVLGAVPPQTATGAAREAVATAFNRPYEVGKNLVDRGADAAFFGWMGKVAETHPTLGQAVGTVGGAVAQGADTVNKVVGTAGLAYFAVTATITTAAALGTAVVAQKVLEQVGVKEEAAGAWSMVASLYVGSKVGNNEAVKLKERAIARGIISKVEGFVGQVREWFGGGRQRTYDIGERTPEGRLAGVGPGTPPRGYEPEGPIQKSKTNPGGNEAEKTVNAGDKSDLLQRRYAIARESGLTRKIQSAIMNSLEEGEIVGIRKRAYGANFLDGKYPAKPMGAEVRDGGALKNGVRILNTGEKVLSDLDIAFVTKYGEILPEARTLDLGKRINRSYGFEVVKHGDNYWGVQKGIGKAIEVANENDTIFIFNKNTLQDTGKYQDMIERYIGSKDR